MQFFQPLAVLRNSQLRKPVLASSLKIPGKKNFDFEPLVDFLDGKLRVILPGSYYTKKSGHPNEIIPPLLFDPVITLEALAELLKENLPGFLTSPKFDEFCKSSGLDKNSVISLRKFHLNLGIRFREPAEAYSDAPTRSWVVSRSIPEEVESSKYLLLSEGSNFCFGWLRPSDMPSGKPLFHRMVAASSSNYPLIWGGGSFKISTGELSLFDSSDQYWAPNLELVQDAAKAVLRFSTTRINNLTIHGLIDPEFDLPSL